jgi:UDP-glucose 4-epimerase
VNGLSSGTRVLVTGGAGFIGSHLVDRLVDEGCVVRVLDDFSSGRESNLDRSKAQLDALVRGSICDEAVLRRACEGVEVVFHEAAVPSVPRSVAEPVRTNQVNVDGTLLVLECARQAGARRVVFAASSSAYGDTEVLPKVESMPATPLSPYALQKYAGEVYCQLYTQLYGLETVALRYFNVFGPRQNPDSEYAAVIPKFVRSCLAGGSPRIFGDGEQTRDFTYVADAVQANWLAATAPRAVGSVINVAGGKRTSLNELFRAVRRLTGATVDVVHEAPRVGDVKHSLASLDRAQELLGFVPSVELDEGLVRTIESFRR